MFNTQNNKGIIKIIKNNINDDMKDLDFRVSGNKYSRITKSRIIQSLEFQGGSSGDNFTININIVPENKNIPFINRELRLCNYVTEAPQWWDYSNKSAEEVSEIIKNKIIPIFKKLSTLEGICEYITHPDVLKDYDEFLKILKNFQQNPELYRNQVNTLIMKPGLSLLHRYGCVEASQICEKLGKKEIANLLLSYNN